MWRTLLMILLFVMMSVCSMYGQVKHEYWYISPKVSFADYSNSENRVGFSSYKTPPFELQVEYALRRKWTVGMSVGFAKESYKNDTYASNIEKESAIGVSAFANYHFTEDLEKWLDYSWDLINFDFYVSLGLRTERQSKDYVDVLQEDGESRLSFAKKVYSLKGGPSIGMRYYLNDHFAMYLECGYVSMGLVTMGITWSLR